MVHDRCMNLWFANYYLYVKDNGGWNLPPITQKAPQGEKYDPLEEEDYTVSIPYR